MEDEMRVAPTNQRPAEANSAEFPSFPAENVNWRLETKH